MRGFFYGWYLKCQSDTQTLAVIPAIHRAGKKCTCSIQIITDEGSWTIPMPAHVFRKSGDAILVVTTSSEKCPAPKYPIGQRQTKKYAIGKYLIGQHQTKKHSIRKHLTGKRPIKTHSIKKPFSNRFRLGRNRFDANGIRLNITTPELRIRGRLLFGPLAPLKYDIMGPFSLIPFLECRHSVFSMRHLVSGTVYINQQKYTFQNARGYWEGDRGRSFPKEYAWTQCFFPGGSLILSVADIPILGFHFTGVICNILWKGSQYRMATYLGARAVQIRKGMVRIVQGELELEARLLKRAGRPLQAPDMGDMIRTIHENASGLAFYRFRKGNRTLFAFVSEQASFEYEYPY